MERVIPKPSNDPLYQEKLNSPELSLNGMTGNIAERVRTYKAE